MSLLKIDHLRKQFGGLVAVNDISFSLDPGEIVGLLGPNGSGKTTALNMISGVFGASAGDIFLHGERITQLKANQIAHKGIARTFQLVRPLTSLSVIENVEAALAFKKRSMWGIAARERARALLTQVGISGAPDRPTADLTYIDLKRLELARALAAEPELLLLDEWLAGLNPTELHDGIDLVASLRESGITILLVEHVMDAVRALCGRCIVMNTGTMIADGPTHDVLADPEVIHAYLGDEYA